MASFLKSLEFKINLAKKRVEEKWELYVVKDSDWPDSYSKYWIGTDNDLAHNDVQPYQIMALVTKYDGRIFVERF